MNPHLHSSSPPPSAIEPLPGVTGQGALPLGRRDRLIYLAVQFFKIGAIGFGGGMAVVALIERECVRRNKCVEAEEFLHGVGLGQILGPFAVNASIFIGYRMAGIAGGLVAATAFMLPSLVLVIALSWVYFTFHTIPSLQGALAGIGSVVIALILSAAGAMGLKALRSWQAVALAILGCAGALLRANPIWILAAAGAIGLLLKLGRGRQPAPKPAGTVAASAATVASLGITSTASASEVLAATTLPAVTATAALPAISLGTLAGTFLKVGLLFFGGGFVLIPILYQHLVGDLGWLTQRQFTDGVAISQLTPGPIAVLATFAGYRVAGVLGAILATVALFTPSTVLMLLISHYYQRLRNLVRVKDFLAGILPAVVGLIVAAAVALGPGSLSLHHPAGIALGVGALFVLLRWRWHPAIVLAIGAAAGTMLPAWFTQG